MNLPPLSSPSQSPDKIKTAAASQPRIIAPETRKQVREIDVSEPDWLVRDRPPASFISVNSFSDWDATVCLEIGRVPVRKSRQHPFIGKFPWREWLGRPCVQLRLTLIKDQKWDGDVDGWIAWFHSDSLVWNSRFEWLYVLWSSLSPLHIFFVLNSRTFAVWRHLNCKKFLKCFYFICFVVIYTGKLRV